MKSPPSPPHSGVTNAISREKYLIANYFDFFPLYFPDPPEIEIEQNWYRRPSPPLSAIGGGGNTDLQVGHVTSSWRSSRGRAQREPEVEVELICVVHAVPKAEVIIIIITTCNYKNDFPDRNCTFSVCKKNFEAT